MRELLACLLLLVASGAHAQDCTPQPMRLTASGDGQRGIVPNPDTDVTTNIVPAGYVNLVFDASIGYPPGTATPSAPIEVTLLKQIYWGRNADGTPSWWDEGIAQSVRSTTPLLGWSGALLVFPGERLAARFAQRAGQYYVMYTGVYFPLACLSRYLGLAVASGPSSGVDFTALQTAATALAQKQQEATQALDAFRAALP